jgi:hypothetical protein
MQSSQAELPSPFFSHSLLEPFTAVTILTKVHELALSTCTRWNNGEAPTHARIRFAGPYALMAGETE